MKRIITLFFAGGVLMSSYAQQDKHFSMFTETQIYLNPAVAGSSQEQLQLFTNYRSQWLTVTQDPYRTISASVDWRMLDPDAEKASNYLGAGINFYNDRAGISNYTTNIITLPVSYAIQVGQRDHLSVGLQPAFYQRTINGDNLTWDNQWTGVEFDQGLNNNEVLLNQNMNITRFDMAAGVYWEKIFENDNVINLGLAGHHLTKQRVNILSDDSKLFRKVTLHGQAEFGLKNSETKIRPAVLAFMQGPNKELTFGAAYDFLLKGESRHTAYFNNMHLLLGSYFRVGDALIATASLQMHQLSIGAAYDLNVSRLNVASKGVGAMEFFIRYRMNYDGRTLANPKIH